MVSFKWRHFQKDIILTSTRWYLAYSLSYRDIEELMFERGVCIDHSTNNRWVIKYSSQLEVNFRGNKKRTVGSSWRMDETYIKAKGKWNYLYRAVDKEGQTIDFMLSKLRDKQAAKAFFYKAIGSNGMPEKVTIDKSGSNKSALDAINKGCGSDIIIRQDKYLNNIVEQDHRGIKRIIKPMMGFKSFKSAKATLAGIELHRMLKKRQHKNSQMTSIFEQFYQLAA